MKSHIESVPIQPQTKVSQASLTNKNIKNNEVTLHTTNNKEVKFSYLPEDKVSVAIRNEEGTYTDIKQENLPKELEGLTSPEKFGAFLKSAYVKASVLSDGETKINVAQKLLGGGPGDKTNNKNQGAQVNVGNGKNVNAHNNQVHIGDTKNIINVLPANFVPTGIPKGVVVIDKNHIISDGVVYKGEKQLGKFESIQMIHQFQQKKK